MNIIIHEFTNQNLLQNNQYGFPTHKKKIDRNVKSVVLLEGGNGTKGHLSTWLTSIWDKELRVE
uniref:Uncharacterized protein n=1 Tax=Manihot esculenta TaxID=3983 RepID=A0A2C9WGS8_MANES